MSLHDVWTWLVALPVRGKVLALAVLVVLIELGFRRFAPRARAYRLWTRVFEAMGRVWTAVLLGIIYVLSVGPISIVMRLLARDPLDRSLEREASFWRSHEPNPLGPLAAARHQF